MKYFDFFQSQGRVHHMLLVLYHECIMMSSTNKYHQSNDSYRRILESSTRLSVPAGTSVEDAWKKLEPSLERAAVKGKVVYFTTFWKVAASISLLILTSFLVYQWQRVSIYVPRAEQKLVYFPDGSSVHMNADSKLSYNQLFWSKNRRVSFSGEGIFEVEKGNPFSVKSPNGFVLVKGTKFNVFDREGNFKVACVSGEVEVFGKESDQPIQLTKGYGSINGQRAIKQDLKKELAWSFGEFYFESTPLHLVLVTLEVQYDVTIDYKSIDQNRIYTGYFNNLNLDEALKLVCIPLQLNYEILEEDQIRIFNKEFKV
ncbi:MAG: FecR family protein [Bacteroidota bacterium]